MGFPMKISGKVECSGVELQKGNLLKGKVIEM